MIHKIKVGDQLYEFDNYKDYLEFVNQFVNPIDENLLSVEESVDQFVLSKIENYWYKDLSDLSLIANTVESVWHNEANAIKNWYNKVYEQLYNYKLTINKDNMVTPEEFILSLPELIIE